MLGVISLALLAQVSDPLLEAPPPAGQQVASWEEAVRLFEGRSADLKVAAAEVVRAGGRKRQAIAGLLPSATASGTASFGLLPPPAGLDPTTAAFFGAGPLQLVNAVAQLAVIDFRAWNAVAMAYEAEDATRLGTDDARRLLLLNVAQALLAVVAAERVAELSRVGLRDALQRGALAERAAKAGATTEIDLGRTRQDAELQRAQVVNADESLRQAREALGLALGVSEPVGVTAGFQLEGLADRVLGRCRALAGLEERADLRAAKSREEVARRGALDVKAQFLPSVALRSNLNAYFAGGQALTIWNVQAVLTVPIWDGGARYGSLREAEGARTQAEARREQTERAGRFDVDRARRQVEVALKAKELAQRALEQAERVDALTRKAFDAGLGTSLELVTAASGLRQQQLNLALREYDVVRARVVALFALADCPP
ncbi:MAG: TolC family protein [Myxococcaceae bacterium]|nr:TolC family protein [Myxococcaceae bacterium]